MQIQLLFDSLAFDSRTFSSWDIYFTGTLKPELEWELLLCNLTSERVLCTPFAGQNHLFLTKWNVFTLKWKKERKKKSFIFLNVGPPKEDVFSDHLKSFIWWIGDLFFCKNDPYLNYILNNSDQNFFRIGPFWAFGSNPFFKNYPNSHHSEGALKFATQISPLLNFIYIKRCILVTPFTVKRLSFETQPGLEFEWLLVLVKITHVDKFCNFDSNCNCKHL